LTLHGIARPFDRRVRRVLFPFDRIEPVERSRRARFVDSRTWRHVCRSAIATDVPPGSLATAGTAAIDLLPYQLEPALAIVRGCGNPTAAGRRWSVLGKNDSGGPDRRRADSRRGTAERVIVPRRRQDFAISGWRELAVRFGIEAVPRRRSGTAAHRGAPADRCESVAHGARRDRVDRLRQAT
jgi:hypothetical protein